MGSYIGKMPPVQYALFPRMEPLDVSAESTFDAWLQVKDERTLEEFAFFTWERVYPPMFFEPIRPVMPSNLDVR